MPPAATAGANHRELLGEGRAWDDRNACSNLMEEATAVGEEGVKMTLFQPGPSHLLLLPVSLPVLPRLCSALSQSLSGSFEERMFLETQGKVWEVEYLLLAFLLSGSHGG